MVLVVKLYNRNDVILWYAFIQCRWWLFQQLKPFSHITWITGMNIQKLRIIKVLLVFNNDYSESSDETTIMKLLVLYDNYERMIKWAEGLYVIFLFSYLYYQWEGYSSVFLSKKSGLSITNTVNRRNNHSFCNNCDNNTSETPVVSFSQYIWSNSSSINSILISLPYWMSEQSWF